MKILGWKVYYGNEEIISSKEAEWEDIPNDDVQVIVLYHEPPYRTFLGGHDYYLKVEDEDDYLIFGSSDSLEYIMTRYGHVPIKFGKWSINYDSIKKKAHDDMTL
jgi:Icc-related predicted phosphoesterase